MDEEIEIISPKRNNYKRIIAIFFVFLLFFLILFFGIKAYRITKKIIITKSSSASPYLVQGVDFIDSLSSDNIIKEGDRRINILLLGIGGGEHDGPNLTDTMIVVSIDPKNGEVAMLSVPRDLYIKTDEFDSKKINSIYYLGKSYYDSEEKGLELIKETVSDFLGIPIHYFVLADFDGFVEIIDMLGGVDIEVEESINDPYYPDEDMMEYEGFEIEKGFYTMNGETTLKYARSRKTTSDFDRAKRQQDIIVAVRDKVMEKENFLNIRKIAQIINTLSDNIKMDLQISEIEELTKIIRNIDKNKISMKVIDDDVGGLVYADRIDEMYVLLPNDKTLKEVHDFVRQYFKDPFIVSEDARIVVKNGTKQNGLANNLANELTSFGYNVIETSNAEDRDYSQTFIYDYSGGKKKFTVNFLGEKLNDAPIIELNSENEGCDIEIIVGDDYRNSF